MAKMFDLPAKPRIAVHKFSSCDGCQLALLNAGAALLALADKVNFVHFAEAGPVDPQAPVDIAFIEGSVSTPDEQERIHMIRRNASYVVTIGACATSGGLQALRNGRDVKAWISQVYASPEFIDTLETATAIRQHVHVDFEIWGCPISGEQVFQFITTLLHGAGPHDDQENVCMTCKRQGHACVMVRDQVPCLGPVTKTGCGALCPSVGRGCYGCYGPTGDVANTEALATQFVGFGRTAESVARQFQFIHSQAPVNQEAVKQLEGKKEPGQ